MDYTKIEVYKCNHCEEFHAISVDIVEEHLKECLVNPANKSCVRCKNLVYRNDIEGGKPLKWYHCKHLNQVLTDEDLALKGAECFEKREDKVIPTETTEAYTKYVDSVVAHIQNQ